MVYSPGKLSTLRRIPGMSDKPEDLRRPEAAGPADSFWSIHATQVEDVAPRWHFREQDQDLADRMLNFKFEQAQAYLREDHPDDIKDVVESLGAVFGNCGFMPRAGIEVVVDAATWWVFGELEKLNPESAANAPRLIRRPPFGDEGE